jgi:hypothetical protein
MNKTNRRNEKENKQTKQNKTEQNRTERRKRKRKTTQQTLKRKKLRTPLRNQKSDFLFCVFSATTTTAMNKWRASQDVHDLHSGEIFPLNRCANL